MADTKYELTEEHKAMIPGWADKWIKNALSTKEMDKPEYDIMYKALNKLYEVADLKAPKNIVFVTSPIVGQVAAGIAATLWYFRDEEKQTINVDDVESWESIPDAIKKVVFECLRNESKGTYTVVTNKNEKINSFFKDEWLAKFVLDNYNKYDNDVINNTVKEAWRMSNGGNMWSSYVSYISFFKDVVKLDLPIYEKYQWYELVTIHGGFRWMHPEFCIVADRPSEIHLDNENRPHFDMGPSHMWRDGFGVYHWHGYRIPTDKVWIIEDKARITAETIYNEENAEIRRIMCEITNFAPVEKDAKIISKDIDGNGFERVLMEVKIKDQDVRIIKVINGSLEPDGSRRTFVLGAMPGNTPQEVIANSYGINPKMYREAVRT